MQLCQKNVLRTGKNKNMNSILIVKEKLKDKIMNKNILSSFFMMMKFIKKDIVQRKINQFIIFLGSSSKSMALHLHLMPSPLFSRQWTFFTYQKAQREPSLL